MELLENIKNSIVDVFTPNTTTPIVSKSDIVSLEESERTHRLQQVSLANVHKQNAANISGIIKEQSFPIFKGNVSRGYKRVTTRFEEDERRRRVTNKSESALRRANANKMSRMIQSLGWPFYQQNHMGAEYLVMDPTRILEEEEREWRTSNAYWAPAARHNAAVVANILVWENFQRNPNSGFRHHLSNLQEKERRDRLRPDVANNAMEHAYYEAGLIRQRGAPFYVQETPIGKRDFSQVQKLEELERKRRMTNPEEQQLAHELAGLIGGHLHKESDLEEQERGRRLTDVAQQHIAKENAKHVSLMVRESSSNKLGGAAPMWFSISRNSMRALEEIERTRRLRDIGGQRSAKQHAKLVSDMFTLRNAAPPKPISNIHATEEKERQARIADRACQQIAMKNARKVSGLVARHFLVSSTSKSYALALEEGERSNRMQDYEQQELAKDNARKISSLVSSLTLAPGNQSRDIPSSTAPIQQAPIISSGPGELLRETSPLVAAAPLNYSSGIPATTIVPLAPVSQSSFTTVPADMLLTSHPSLGERQRKMLEKQVEKHNRKSEKDVRKAEQSMLKAEKLHQKGRDDKASKLEGKAEMLMKTAEHERRWASGILGELNNAPAPASM
jgi:hypothetical protein